MKTIKELLNAAKAAKGVDSDYALAKALNLPTQRISDYSKGTRTPDEFACLQIAQALGRSYEEISAIVRIEAEKDESRPKSKPSGAACGAWLCGAEQKTFRLALRIRSGLAGIKAFPATFATPQAALSSIRAKPTAIRKGKSLRYLLRKCARTFCRKRSTGGCRKSTIRLPDREILASSAKSKAGLQKGVRARGHGGSGLPARMRRCSDRGKTADDASRGRIRL